MAGMGSSSVWTHHPTALTKATAAGDAQPWIGEDQTLPKLCFAQAVWTKPTGLINPPLKSIPSF